MKPVDTVDITLVVFFGIVCFCMFIRTIAAWGIWSSLKGIRKELAKGNKRAGRFANLSEYHEEHDDYFRKNHN